MYQESFIDSLSIFIILGLIFGAIALMFEFGYRLALRFPSNEYSQSISPMATGLASLLAFILAISFSMAAAKSAERKQLVLAEANAVGTTILRTGLLTEPYRSRSRELLREYVTLRVVENAKEKKQVVNNIIKESEVLQLKLWTQAIDSHGSTSPELLLLYINSLNEVIDIHTERVNKGLRGRIPVSIWFTLGLLTFLTIALNGVQVGAQNKGRALVAALPFALAFSLVLTLIVELDRPVRSIIEISQQPLVDLRDSLDKVLYPDDVGKLKLSE
ncbi:bestrophin-like domain [Photobacterium sp. DNB22_13_2]